VREQAAERQRAEASSEAIHRRAACLDAVRRGSAEIGMPSKMRVLSGGFRRQKRQRSSKPSQTDGSQRLGLDSPQLQT
jgi:hypothetical protein